MQAARRAIAETRRRAARNGRELRFGAAGKATTADTVSRETARSRISPTGRPWEFRPTLTFRKRIRQEGVGIAKADAVSAPSRDILEQTRAYYGLPLTGAAVIPNAAPAVPAGQSLVAGDVRPVAASFHWPIRPTQGRRRSDRRVSDDRATLSPSPPMVRGSHRQT